MSSLRTEPTVVLGAGGHGREVAMTLIRCGRTLKGFYDDREPAADAPGSVRAAWLGPLAAYDGEPAVVGIGDGAVRRDVSMSVNAAAAIIDPAAVVGFDVSIHEGSIIFAGSTVTVDIEIGRHVHIGRNVAVGHDCRLSDFSSVMPGASLSGNVSLDQGAYVGAGAVIRQGVTIGADALVGIGAVVLRDVAPGTVVVGNPARPLRARGHEA